MAAQSRLSCPVRCAAISQGLIFPSYPKLPSCPNPSRWQSVILQNKPNFPKLKIPITSCSEMTYENKPPSPPPSKQTQSNPIFSWCRVWSFGFGAWNLFGILDSVLSPRRSKAKPGGILLLGDCTPESRATSPESRDTILQNKPNFQKPKMNLNLYPEVAYENIILPDDPKNKPNSKPNQIQFMRDIIPSDYLPSLGETTWR